MELGLAGDEGHAGERMRNNQMLRGWMHETFDCRVALDHGSPAHQNPGVAGSLPGPGP